MPGDFFKEKLDVGAEMAVGEHERGKRKKVK